MLRKLFSETAIYGVSTTISKFLNYLLVPYLTRILGDDVYGEQSLYYALIPFANVLLTMGLTTGYFRFAAKCTSENEKRVLFSSVWTAVSILSVLFFVIVASFSDSINYGDVQWYMVVTAGLIMVDNINAMPLAALREQGRAARYTLINVTSVVINVIACWALYSLIPGATSQAGWVMVANLLASVISLFMLLPSALKMYVGKLSFAVLRTITIYSIPLMVAGVMGVASDFIDRQMLDIMLPNEVAKSQVGIYSAVTKIAALMVIFRQIYSLGAEPFFLQNFSREDFRRLNAAALKYFTIAGLTIFLVITLFEGPFGYILGSNFRGGMAIVPLLLLANLFSGILINLSFWYKQANMTNIAIWVTLVGVTLTIGLNYWLIPIYSYEGSAWARFVATLAMVIMSYILGQKYYKIPYDIKRISLYFCIAATIYIISRYTAALSIGLQYSANFLLILCYALLAIKLEWKKLKLK